MRRWFRYGLMLIALYLTFLGGSAYYHLIFQVRVLHHFVVTLLLLLWLFRRIRSGNGLPYTPLNPPIYAAVGVWFAASLTGLDPRMSLESTWFLIIHVLFFFVLVDLFQRGRQKQIMETQFMMAVLVVFITGLELASWYFGLGIIPGTDISWLDAGVLIPPQMLRVSLAMNISTLLAGYVAPLIILAITWALTSSRRSYRVVLWLLAGSLTAVLLLTYSRGGLLSLMAGLGALSLFRFAQHPAVRRRVDPRWVLGSGAIAGLVVLVGVVSILLLPSRRSGDEGRVDMYRSAVAMTADYPVLGVGVGQFGRAFREYRTPELARDRLASAHNLYLNAASETGVVGLAVGCWLLLVFSRAAWHNWRDAQGRWRRIRLEGVVAALVGVSVHSVVDVFTTTPIVLVILVLGAYAVVGHRTWQDDIPKGQRVPAMIAFMLIAGYGLAFIQFDRAQSHYMNSLTGATDRLEAAQTATAIDPHLNLYHLHLALVQGAESALLAAVEREPTWDTGWMQLAALAETAGDIESAIDYLRRAYDINPLTAAGIHWARLAEMEKAAPEADIVAAYQAGQMPHLPLSEFWWETPLRQQAVQAMLVEYAVDEQYRVLSVHDPENAAEIVPDDPQTAAAWWVVGQHRLTLQADPESARAAFSRAVELAPNQGDYYASRARAAANLADAEPDLLLAELYGTRHEYPDAIRAGFITDEAERHRLYRSALPIHFTPQEFAATLYARPASFDVPQSLRFPGLGREALNPWYALAYDLLADGKTEEAVDLFAFILSQAPFETEAAAMLDELRAEGL